MLHTDIDPINGEGTNMNRLQSAEESTTFKIVGTGSNVYESEDPVEGVAKWLETPQDVMDFVEQIGRAHV